MKSRKCKHCHTRFTPTRHTQVYCCKKHQQQAQNIQRQKRKQIEKQEITRKCKYCGNPFTPTHLNQIYCCPEHYTYYNQEKHITKKFKEKQGWISFWDSRIGKMQCMKREHLRLGSMKTSLGSHRKQDFQEEQRLIQKQKWALGLGG